VAAAALHLAPGESQDASAPPPRAAVAAFTRVENPATNGFTVEGYPIGHIGGGDPDSEVIGVKSKAATPKRPQPARATRAAKKAVASGRAPKAKAKKKSKSR